MESFPWVKLLNSKGFCWSTGSEKYCSLNVPTNSLHVIELISLCLKVDFSMIFHQLYAFSWSMQVVNLVLCLWGTYIVLNVVSMFLIQFLAFIRPTTLTISLAPFLVKFSLVYLSKSSTILGCYLTGGRSCSVVGGGTSFIAPWFPTQVPNGTELDPLAEQEAPPTIRETHRLFTTSNTAFWVVTLNWAKLWIVANIYVNTFSLAGSEFAWFYWSWDLVFGAICNKKN